MNDKYDEAVDVSQSMDQGAKMDEDKRVSSSSASPKAPHMTSLPEEKTNSFMNKPFDEALEFSQSNSDESVDTRGGDRKQGQRPEAKSAAPVSAKATPSVSHAQPKAASAAVTGTMASLQVDEESGSEESEEEDEIGQQNYDNIDGAYNPKDYAHLNVTAEIRDLFQYIERYKVQPVELETTLKCFVPDYIPSIGEMDAFIKVRLLLLIDIVLFSSLCRTAHRCPGQTARRMSWA